MYGFPKPFFVTQEMAHKGPLPLGTTLRNTVSRPSPGTKGNQTSSARLEDSCTWLQSSWWHKGTRLAEGQNVLDAFGGARHVFLVGGYLYIYIYTYTFIYIYRYIYILIFALLYQSLFDLADAHAHTLTHTHTHACPKPPVLPPLVLFLEGFPLF